MKRKILLICLMCALGFRVTGQPGPGSNNTCETASPFCTGTLYNFPAGVNAGSGQPGPCYNCLTTTPNPAWYYMKVANPGNIIIYMHSQPAHDIDFCCWGPFASQFCCTQLTCPTVVDCSYSPAPTETCNINGALTGEYYILIITNYSNQPCNIIFEQTGGNGTTDCTILPPPATNNSPICEGQTLQLSSQAIANATYEWWGPNNFQSSQQNPSIANATQVNAGDYFLRIIVNGQPSADTSVTTTYIYDPQANAGNDTSIANGVYTILHGSCTNGSGSYNFQWEPADKLVDPNIQSPQTLNLYTATVFTLTVIDDSAGCESTDFVTVDIIGGALAVNALADPSSICVGTSTQLQAIGSGGAGNYTYQWSGPGGFSSALQNPTVAPAQTSDYSVTISDGYNTSSSAVTVTVIPLPVADAGLDQEIDYGFWTFLIGSATGGTGNYFYSWTPTDKLLNASVQYPQTIKLTETTTYSLVVTDLTTSCVSDNVANVTIDVVGGPLNVNPVATPGWICRGDSTQLHAGAGGGHTNSFCQYTWSSIPAGFNSTKANPFVSPVENTIYHISVWDSSNTVEGSASVNLYDDPYIRLGPPDTTICVYDTILLDAGNQGSTYLWSDGSITRTIVANSTGIGYETQIWTVKVTTGNGCTKSSAIELNFSFEGCVSIDEISGAGYLKIYPNPASESITIEVSGIRDEISGQILNANGIVVRAFNISCTNGKTGTSLLDIASLPAGVYVIRISGNFIVQTKKLVIE